MRIGVTFPTMEIIDPLGCRDLAQAVEGLGYTHLLAWEQVLGVDVTNRPDWQGVPTLADIHEPLVLFGYLAGVTRTVELATGVLVLPQRQTGVVAKQVAELHLLSGGRVRLGVGIGWVRPQFDALGMDWADRAARLVEQVAVLRALLTDDVVTFDGRWHRIEEMGVRPRPATPVPIWLGGNADATLARAVALADGWMPMFSLAEAKEADLVGRLRAALDDAGRRLTEDDAPADTLSPAGPGFGLETTLNVSGGFHVHRAVPRPVEDLLEEAQAWADLGVTHLKVNTQGLGWSADEHIRFLGELRAGLTGP